MERVDLFEAENASLCDRQIAAVRASARRRIGALEERLRRASDPHADPKLRRTEPLIRAQLTKAEEGLALQEVKMARSRRVGEDSHQPIGLVAVVRP